MRALVLVGIGSGIGGVARYALVSLALALAGPHFPVGTLLVNILGSVLIGVFAALARAESRYVVSSEARALLAIGFCGGFTTFSFFAWQVMVLGAASVLVALSYVIASFGLSFLAVSAGYIVTVRNFSQ
jgi:fluoride exporter